mmetsp:Transcript_17512/g.23642  ORF Transcript_17512/g.23642 Transcript_17512/m.23642 type:complete len:81 (-) Transcript_17512:1519-1761(-)
MTLGSILLIMAYISTFYNERKYLNLSRFQAIVKEQLYRADLHDNKTRYENENKLVFAQGELSFAEPARDSLLQFQSRNGV